MVGPRRDQYRIVVGFDGSEGGKRALEWAAGEARMRDALLSVVEAWTPGEFGTYEEMGVIAQKALEVNAAAVLGDDPGVDVELLAERGHASAVLLRHGLEADMLVVGSRGLGGFTGLLLGSVGQQVMTHQGAPVVVVVRE